MKRKNKQRANKEKEEILTIPDSIRFPSRDYDSTTPPTQQNKRFSQGTTKEQRREQQQKNVGKINKVKLGGDIHV
jgi:hypothetical protein